MLDDLNKLVPKLDEDDKERMFNNINNMNNNKKPKKAFGKNYIIVTLSFILVLAILIPTLIIISNNNNSSEKENNNTNTNTPTTSYDPKTSETIINTENNTGYGPGISYDNNEAIVYLEKEDLLGVAAFNAFENKTTEKLMHFNETDYNPLMPTSTSITHTYEEKIIYPFNFVEIVNAYKFKIEVDDIIDSYAKKVIEEKCGLGIIEVVVADFNTYDDINSYSLIEDKLISFRGENGYYTSLMNGGELYSNTWFYTFSEHKKISDEGVTKELSLKKGLKITLKEDFKKLSLTIYSGNEKRGEDYSLNEAYCCMGEYETLTVSRIFKVNSLIQYPIIMVECKIVSLNLDEGIINVSSDIYNLDTINIDENTKIEEELEIDMIINVKYYQLFKYYNPKTVTAIEILKSDIEIDENTPDESSVATIDNTQNIDDTSSL